MLCGCAIFVEYINLYAHGLFYNAIVVSYSISLPFFCIISLELFIFFCNDHLIGVSRWRCRCSGTSCGWNTINLDDRAILDPIRYSLETEEIVEKCMCVILL